VPCATGQRYQFVICRMGWVKRNASILIIAGRWVPLC
jgi:hypothetical protein